MRIYSCPVSAVRSGVFSILFLALLWGGFAPAEGAYLRNFPVTVLQPDGSTLPCFASGDEFYNWLHDARGYTIMQDPVTGYYVYAVTAGGSLAASSHVAGQEDPAELGLEPNVSLSPTISRTKSQRLALKDLLRSSPVINAPHSGTLNNIVIFIRFSDETEFTDLATLYTNMLNTTTAGYNSMYNYFREASYNQLSITTALYPNHGATVVSYQDAHPRGYYRPYNAVTNTIGYQNGGESSTREWTLLQSAVTAVSSQIPVSPSVDNDGDGYVDNVTFVVRGGPDGWNDLLWPHYWNMPTATYPAYINGKLVSGYNVQLQESLKSSGVGVLCHEMFHSLGAPDLYHYTNNGMSPVGAWDIMEWDQNPPQHMGAYMKFAYGKWISSIPVITTSGTYTLSPLTSATGNAYRINSPHSATEYFIVEFRKKSGTFEASLPGEGLLVYRINSSVAPIGNRNGPPDEVYIYRPGGTNAGNGVVDAAAYSNINGRMTINDTTDPSSFLSNGAAGGLNITNIFHGGNTISFRVDIGASPLPSARITQAAAIGTTTATLSGTANSHNALYNATVTFEYGKTTAYGGSIAATPSSVGSADTAVSATVNGLTPNTLYHYRIRVTTRLGTGYSDDMEFVTAGACGSIVMGGLDDYPPLAGWGYGSSTNCGTPLCDAYSDPVNCIPHSNAGAAMFGCFKVPEMSSLSQSVVIPNNPAQQLWFYLYNPSASGNNVDAFTVTVDGRELLTVTEGDPLFTSGYRLVSLDLAPFADGGSHLLSFNSAISGATFFLLDDISIACSEGQMPAVNVNEARNVTAAEVVLSGTVNAYGLNTSLYFDVDTTTKYSSGYFLPSPSKVGLVGEQPVSVWGGGLVSGTTYHYRLRAKTDWTVAYSRDLTFSTDCLSTAVKIGGIPFQTIQAAVSAAVNGNVINTNASAFSENITVGGSGTITLSGGYDCTTGSTVYSTTKLYGSITIGGSRTVIINNYTVQ